MAFSDETLRQALNEVNNRRKNAERQHESKLSALYGTDPVIKSIDDELKVKSSKAALYLISGNVAAAEKLRDEVTELNVQRKSILSIAGITEHPVFTCNICNDTGYKDGRICSCVKDIASKISYRELLGNMPIKDSTFENFDVGYYSENAEQNGISPQKHMTAVLKTCKSFAESFPEGKNIFFTGCSGLGKTHLSLAIANEVLKKGYGVIYGSAQNLINEVGRETFDRSGSTAKIDSLNSCDLLILDDLGTEVSTSLSSSIVYNIVNTRLNKGLSTVISTNLDIKQIQATYGERISSRIVGYYTPCPCIGSDIRLIKAKNRTR